MMKNKETDRKLTIIVCILILTVTAVFVSQLVKLRTQTQFKYYYSTLKAGEIAENSIISSSSFDIVDFEATAAEKKQRVAAVSPRFTISADVNYEIQQKFNEIKAQKVYSENLLDFAYEIIHDLMVNGIFDYQEKAQMIAEGNKSFHITNTDKEVSVFDTASLANLEPFIKAKLGKYSSVLSEDDKNDIFSIVGKCIIVNTYFNELETQMAVKRATDSVENVVINIKKGQVLIEKDYVITREKLNLLLLIASQERLSVSEIIGKIVFCLVCFSMEMYTYSFLVDKEDLSFNRYTMALTISTAISFFATFFAISYMPKTTGNFIEIYMPVAFAPVLMAMMTGKKRVGFLSAFLFGTGMCILPGANMLTLFFCCTCGCICVYTIKFVNKRADSIIQSLVSIAIVALFYVLFMVSGSYLFDGIVLQLFVVSTITVISLMIINIVLPICEKVMNLPTVYRLYELAYGESKLLKKLASEAPGTYEHSCRVSDLSQAAASAIGANSILAKVGGLYHDIGKTEHPEYFIENQSGDNKHEELNPSLSASIIKSHVKVGAEKGREFGLPKEVVDIIYQHHGNDVIAFFYNEAVKDNTFVFKDVGEVEKSDYCYTADIPSSRECAIVMLADSVEAASRTIQSPTAAQFERLINQIVLSKIEHGQLNNCKLTLKDIDVISQSFLKSLSAMYHSRIEYPDEEDD